MVIQISPWKYTLSWKLKKLNKFPAIVYNDALTSEPEISSEHTVSPLNDGQINFGILFDEFDDEDYIGMYDKDSFSYKLISVNDFKTDSENDIDEVDLPHNNVIEQLDSDIDYNIDTQSLEFNEDFKITHDIHREPLNMEDYLIIIEVVIQKHFYEGMPLIFIIKNLYVSFAIPFDPKRFYKVGVCTRKLQRLIPVEEALSPIDSLQHFRERHAEGRKRRAKMSGGHFVGWLVEYFRLVTDEGLIGLTMIAQRQPVATARAHKGTKGAPVVDEDVQAVLAPQPPPVTAPTRTMP
nr:hypothetical protein [Tanacetum cinerariifolium]